MIKIFANLNIILHLLAEQPPQENIPPQYFLIVADAGLCLRLAECGNQCPRSSPRFQDVAEDHFNA